MWGELQINGDTVDVSILPCTAVLHEQPKLLFFVWFSIAVVLGHQSCCDKELRLV